MSSSSLTNQNFCRELPYPLAIAWRRYLLARNESAKVEHLIGVLDIFLRVLLSYLLSDYLQHPSVVSVENELSKLSRPSLGTYRSIIREILFSIHENDEALFREIAKWHFKSNGKPTSIAKTLDNLISMRNEHAHGHARTEFALQPYREEFENKIRELLSSATWLFSFRLFYVLDSVPSRIGGYTGNIQWFIGDSSEPIPEEVHWNCILFPEVVYLCHPDGQHFLELTPFVQILSYESAKRCFLFLDIRKNGLITLRLDIEGEERQQSPQVIGEPTVWETFLTKRNIRKVSVHNTNSKDFEFLKDKLEYSEIFGTRYRMIQKIGVGAMAEVFAVEDQETNKTWALKIIRQELVNERGKERFQREIQVQYSIKHPYIISINSVTFLPDGRCAIRMDWMKRGTLKDKIEEDICSPEEVSEWTRQLLDALKYLSQNGIVHRDIKPSNILLSDNNQIKLSDFGIAKRDGDIRLTKIEEKIGSWPYMAPEIRLGKSEPSLESDLYSLGVTLHELLTGELSDQPGENIPGVLGTQIRLMANRNPEERKGIFELLNESKIESRTIPVSKTEQDLPPKKSCFTKGCLGCLGTFLIFCVIIFIPTSGEKDKYEEWSKIYLTPIKEAYNTGEITDTEIQERLIILRKDIINYNADFPPNTCFQQAIIAELGELKGKDGYLLGHFTDAHGNERQTPLSPPKSTYSDPDKSILTLEEARQSIIHNISTLRKASDKALEDINHTKGNLVQKFLRGCAKTVLLDLWIDDLVQKRERGLQKTLTEVSEHRYSVPMFIEEMKRQTELQQEATSTNDITPTEISIANQTLLQEETLLDIHGVLIGCSGFLFKLSSSDSGSGKVGVQLEFLGEQLDAMWDVEIGDQIHARCVIEGMQPPYWLSSCVRMELPQ